MNIGRLRHRVELQRMETYQDPNTGDLVTGFRTYATVWAEVRGLSGRTYYAAQQTTAASTHEVRMRHRTDVEPGHRILHDGKTYTVDAALDPTGRREELVVVAKEVAPA